MPSRVNVKNEVNGYRLRRDALLQRFPDIDDETLRDTLDGISDLSEMIAEITRSSLKDHAMASGLKARIEGMRARLSRLEARASKKRQLVLDTLIDAGIKKLVREDFTLSLRTGARKLVVTSEDEIPEDYWLEQASKLDRQGLIAALLQGQKIRGVRLSKTSPTLSVRTK